MASETCTATVFIEEDVKRLRDAFNHIQYLGVVQSALNEREQQALDAFRARYKLRAFHSSPNHMPLRKSDGSVPPPEEHALMLELRHRILASEASLSAEQRAFVDNDFNLIRFLRARRLQIDPAFKLLHSTLRWRGNHKPLELDCQSCHRALRAHLANPSVPYQNTSCSDLRFIGYDPMGRPVMYCSFRHTQHRGSSETIAHTAAALEKALLVMNDEAPGDVIVVNNFNGFSFSDLNPLVGIRAIQIFSDYYPELLKCMIVVDPPRIFWPLFHRVLKPLLAKETAAKAVFLDSTLADGGRAVLKEFFDAHITEWMANRIKEDY